MTNERIKKLIYFNKEDKMVTLNFVEPTFIDLEKFEKIHGKIFMTFIA